jgi:integrase
LAQESSRQQFCSAYKGDLDLIFANPDGTLLKADSISSAVSLLFRELKIPKPKGAALHLFRHSHGSHLLAAGMELPAVSERLATVQSWSQQPSISPTSQGGIKRRPLGGINFSGYTTSRGQSNEMCDRNLCKVLKTC